MENSIFSTSATKMVLRLSMAPAVGLGWAMGMAASSTSAAKGISRPGLGIFTGSSGSLRSNKVSFGRILPVERIAAIADGKSIEDNL